MFQISLDNCKNTKVRDFTSDFVSRSQESRSGEIGKNFKVFLYNVHKYPKLIKAIFIFIWNHH